VSHPRRTASQIAFDILKEVDEKGEATKWDLLRIVGNTQQFRHWVEDFLLPKKVLTERIEEGARKYYYYSLTERGKLFLNLLKSGNMIELMRAVSGRRLRRENI